MAIGAAIGIGAGMAAAGGGIAASGLTVKGTKPRAGRYNYGGTAEATDAYRDQYAQGIGAAQKLGTVPIGTFAGLESSGATAQGQGLGTLTQALRSGGFGTEGGANVSGFDPGAVARAQSAATLAQATRATNAIARTGGAAGLRQAINANAGAGVAAAQQSAVLAAQGEQAQTEMALQNQQLINATRFGMAGLGAQQQAFGAGLQADAASNVANIGLTREGLYNQQQTTLEGQQLQAQIEYERARQQSALDKRRLIVGLGAGLLGAGGQVMASGMGGGR